MLIRLNQLIKRLEVIKYLIGNWKPVTKKYATITDQVAYVQKKLDLLNEAKIATIIRNNGFRLWGNRTTAQDPLWQFLPVRRTADLIYDSIERALLWAMDRPLSRQLFADIEGSVNAYLRELIALGAIVGGKAWLDPDLNTPATLQAGKLYVDFDIEPPAPLERLTFRAHRNAEYWTEALAV